MAKEDLAGILGTVLSSLFATLGFLWSIGILQLLFSFLAGAFATYAVQRRLQVESEKRRIKRENDITMRDKIYGPIFREMNEILDGVASVQSHSWEIRKTVEETRAHYLFYKIGRDLKNELNALLDRIEIYETIFRATQTLVLRAIKDAVAKAHKVDIGVQVGVVRLRLELEEMTVDELYLEQALLQEITPAEFVKTVRKRWGENVTVEVQIAGTKLNLDDLTSLYKVVLDRVRQELVFHEEKKQRKILMDELEAFLELIKPHVYVE